MVKNMQFLKHVSKNKTLITCFFVLILILTFINVKISIIVSDNNLNNIFLTILEPTNRVIYINPKNATQAISYLNEAFRNNPNIPYKAVIVDYIEYSPSILSLIHVLQALDFQLISIGSYVNYWIICGVIVFILALISQSMLSPRNLKKAIPYLALLTTALVPSEYFMIVFTSVLSVIVLGVESKFSCKKRVIKFSKKFSFQDVLLTAVLVTIFSVYVLREYLYVGLFSGIIFGLIFVFITKIYAPDDCFKTISSVGVFAGITIMFLKLKFVQFPYGTDLPLKFLLAVIAAKLAKEDSIVSFLNSFIVATLISI